MPSEASGPICHRNFVQWQAMRGTRVTFVFDGRNLGRQGRDVQIVLRAVVGIPHVAVLAGAGVGIAWIEFVLVLAVQPLDVSVLFEAIFRRGMIYDRKVDDVATST